MTNLKKIHDILCSVVAGMQDLLETTLQLDNYDAITPTSWGKATSALRSVGEAVKLLDTITTIDLSQDIESMPEIDAHSMNIMSSTFGNRCYWQNVALQRWLQGKTDSTSGVPDHRFELDFDEITTETTTTTTKKTTKKKIPLMDLVEKKG